MKNAGFIAAVLVVGALTLVAGSLYLPVHRWLWPGSQPCQNEVLGGLRLTLAAGIVDAVALTGCLAFALATRRRFGGHGRHLGFVALAWLGVFPARTILELLRTGWLWTPTRVRAEWRTAAEYDGDPATYIAFALSIGAALLFLRATRSWSSRPAERARATQQDNSPDEARKEDAQ